MLAAAVCRLPSGSGGVVGGVELIGEEDAGAVMLLLLRSGAAEGPRPVQLQMTAASGERVLRLLTAAGAINLLAHDLCRGLCRYR